MSTNETKPEAPERDPAEICAEMARDAATIAARHDSNYRESADDIDSNLRDQYQAQSRALREAERRIRLVHSNTTSDVAEQLVRAINGYLVGHGLAVMARDVCKGLAETITAELASVGLEGGRKIDG